MFLSEVLLSPECCSLMMYATQPESAWFKCGTNMSVSIRYQYSATVDHYGRNIDNLALHPWHNLGT